MSTDNTVSSTSPTTLLEAVNAVLEAARMGRVNSLTDIDYDQDALGAKLAIDAASRTIQKEGWEWNREWDATLQKDGDGRVPLPLNTLAVVTARTSTANRRLTQRGNFLYDPKLRTDIINDDAKVDIRLLLEFGDVPQHGKDLITAMAARAWALPKLPNGATFRYTEEVVNAARIGLEQLDADLIDGEPEERSKHFALHRRR